MAAQPSPAPPPKPKPVPYALLNKAMKSLEERLEGCPSVVGLGIGIKTVDGVREDPPRLAVRVLVTYKRAPRKKRWRIPKYVMVEYRGKRRRVMTDVEAVPQAAERHNSQAFHTAPARRQDPPGSAGFALSTSNGSTKLLATAGHALPRAGATTVTHGDSFTLATAPGAAGALQIGPALAHDEQGGALSFYFDAAGDRHDQGIVRIESGVPIDAVRDHLGVGLFGYVASVSELFAGIGTPCTLRSARPGSSVTATLEEVFLGSLPFDFGETYAPVLLRFESMDGPFAPGDSGAPMVDPVGRVYGLHVVGVGPLGKPKMTGWSVAACTIIKTCRERFTSSLHFVKTS